MIIKETIMRVVELQVQDAVSARVRATNSWNEFEFSCPVENLPKLGSDITVTVSVE